MSKELDVRQLVQRIEDVPCDGEGTGVPRARVLSVTQEVVGDESADMCRLLEKMNLGAVRFVATTSYDNTSLVRCYAPFAAGQIVTTLLTLYGNIGLITLLFSLMK